MHCMIMHEVKIESLEHELWYAIKGTTMTFLQVEFELVTSLRFEIFLKIISKSD